MSAAIVISLDFELRWGLFDILGDDVGRYRRNLEGVGEVVPRLLDVFAARDIHATWATVGAVACESWDEWMTRTPSSPLYEDRSLRWRDEYRRLDPDGRLHFAPHLVTAIVQAPGQELASHTFSHVYVREPGFSRADAVADADAMVRFFRERFQSTPRSLVFPRNQVAHTDVLRERGIVSWRENPRTEYWRATAAAEQSSAIRLLRLADSLLPLGRRTAPQQAQRASFFVRVGLPGTLWNLHLARIRGEAGRLGAGESLHLWWHPHNLGDDPAGKTRRIEELLDAIRDSAPSGTRFRTMGDIALA